MPRVEEKPSLLPKWTVTQLRDLFDQVSPNYKRSELVPSTLAAIFSVHLRVKSLNIQFKLLTCPENCSLTQSVEL